MRPWTPRMRLLQRHRAHPRGAQPDLAAVDPITGVPNPFTEEEARKRLAKARQERADRAAHPRPGRGDYQAQAEAALKAKGGRADAA